MKKILTLAALTAAILTTNIPAYATADLPDLRISDSGQQIVEGQSATPEQTAEQTPAQVEDLSPYNTKPDPPEGICYTVTDLNIHQAADANSPIVGTYKKGESISILGNEGDEWSYTNLGYVYNGYLCKTQRYNVKNPWLKSRASDSLSGFSSLATRLHLPFYLLSCFICPMHCLPAVSYSDSLSAPLR